MGLFGDLVNGAMEALAVAREKTADPDFLEDVDFQEKVRGEIARVSKGRAGVIEIEVKTILEHFHQADCPVRDLTELLAITKILVERYNDSNLLPWAKITSHEDAYETFKTSFFPEDDVESWSYLLIHDARVLHHQLMEEDPQTWLVEWNPANVRLHAAKVKLLRKAKLSTLTKMLRTLCDREIDLFENSGYVSEEADFTSNRLWQSITATRTMRTTVEDIWCVHHKVPKDYALAIDDRTPVEQIAFLDLKKEQLQELCDQASEEEDRNAPERLLIDPKVVTQTGDV